MYLYEMTMRLDPGPLQGVVALMECAHRGLPAPVIIEQPGGDHVHVEFVADSNEFVLPLHEWSHEPGSPLLGGRAFEVELS